MKAWIGVAALLVAGVAETGAQAAPPAGLAPTYFRASVIYVADLEAEKAWYQDKLGMTLVRTIFHGTKPHEYAMGFGPGAAQTALFLAENTTGRAPGKNLNSRIILDCPNAEALALWLKSQGSDFRESHPHANYHVADPEGNDIELYTAPKS